MAMSTNVIKASRWWGSVDRTQTVDAQAIEIKDAPPSLDDLAANIRHATSRVVHLQCEIAKALDHENDCRRLFVKRLEGLDQELCFTQTLHLPRD
jgi:hypothetical protein